MKTTRTLNVPLLAYAPPYDHGCRRKKKGKKKEGGKRETRRRERGKEKEKNEKEVKTSRTLNVPL